jgi:hypothetical protein
MQPPHSGSNATASMNLRVSELRLAILFGRRNGFAAQPRGKMNNTGGNPPQKQRDGRKTHARQQDEIAATHCGIKTSKLQRIPLSMHALGVAIKSALSRPVHQSLAVRA